MHIAGITAMSALLAAASPALAQDKGAEAPAQKTPEEIIESAPETAWRPLDPENTIYMDLPAGTVVIELKPDFAPKHVARIKELTRQGFYEGLKFHRVIEGFMAQGGDPKGDGTGGSSLPNVEGEFSRDTNVVEDFHEIGRDRTTPRIGFIDGMPVGAQPEALRAFKTDRKVDLWPLHCPGTMSMARATDPNSANSQFFLMIGDARQSLDRRYSAWGWIVDGYEASRRISRGEPPLRPTPIMRVRVEADIPQAERKNIQVFDTDSDIFVEYLKTRGDISDTGYVKNICEIRVPVRINGKIER